MAIASFRRLAALLSLVALAACSSVSLVNAWSSPGAHGAPFKSILVVGISPEEGPRRTFEDTFAQALTGYGVQALPLYARRPELGELPEAKLKALLADTDADAVLVTRQVRHDQRLQVIPGSEPLLPGPNFGFYGFYRHAWLNYQAPTAYQYNVAVMETNLWSARDSQLVWSGTTETRNPENVPQASRDFAKVVSKALAKHGLLPLREAMAR
jgi:hypothetical protein